MSEKSKRKAGIIIVALVALLLLGIGGLFAFILSSDPAVTFNAEGLSMEGAMYSETVARGELSLDKGRIINVESDPDLAPDLRTNGIGLPGHQEGWYTLKNGEKAFMIVTSPEAAYIPTSKGWSAIVSVALFNNPDELRGALKGSAPKKNAK